MSFFGLILGVGLSACDYREEWQLGYLPQSSSQSTATFPLPEKPLAGPNQWQDVPADTLSVMEPPADSLSEDEEQPPVSDGHFFRPDVEGWEADSIEIRLN